LLKVLILKNFKRDLKMKISEIIDHLEKIKEEQGDLEVYSVNYHSDYYDAPLERETIDEQIVVIDPDKGLYPPSPIERSTIHEKYLLIYGGSY
jgi:hypothetical protein